MTNIDQFNLYGTTGIDGIMIDLAERMDDKVKSTMKAWYDEDPRNTNAYSSRDHSAQSESTYWTVGDDEFDFCVRLAAHKAVACVSEVHLSINIMDHITIDGDDWFIDYAAACQAVDRAAAAILEKIA